MPIDPLDRASLAKTPEWRNVDLKTFRAEIIPRDRPAVLKGLVGHWPLVRAGRQSPQALLDYIGARDPGVAQRILIGRPEIKGLYFFRDDLTGLNFEYSSARLEATLARILKHANGPNPPGIFMPAAAVESFPQIGRENTLDIPGKPAVARLWLGNRVTTATHFDMSDNVHCVAAGLKRFTFFPPEQLANLYVGPLELSPGGQPTSLVKVTAPDLERYPRFAQALAAAQVTEIEPGDAIFIPSLWWHNVEALEPVNFSINFWWCEPSDFAAEPFGALVHSLLALRQLTPERREIWRQMFDHYVFQTHGDPVPYLPPDRRGMLGPLSSEQILYLKKQLMRSLIKQMPREMSVKILQALFPEPTR